MWLYWFCAHPITGCVVLCTQNKKSQGKELNCPMAAAIIMGGVCVCCAPCICIGLCMGIEPLFRKTDVQMPQQPGVALVEQLVLYGRGGWQRSAGSAMALSHGHKNEAGGLLVRRFFEKVPKLCPRDPPEEPKSTPKSLLGPF